MKSFVRTLSATLLVLVSAAAVACGGGGGSGGGEGGNPTGSGTGAGDTGTGAGDTGSSSSGGTTAFDWAGTWTVDLSYSVSCDFGFDNIKNGSWTQTDTIVLMDTGSGGLAASFPNAVNYSMSGTGNDHLLTLTGQYPAKDNGGGAASIGQDENTVTLKIDMVQDQNHASGAMSGQFNGEFGQTCTIMMGTVSLAR